MGHPLRDCAPWDTPVDTPDGEVLISLLDEGDLVWSLHRGEKVAVPVIQLNRTPVENHLMVRVVLEGGDVIDMSRGHPTADGRPFQNLSEEEMLYDRAIVDVSTVSYPGAHTYDILPDSDTGVYFVHGIPVGSTLHTPKPTAPAIPLPLKTGGHGREGGTFLNPTLH